MADDRVLEETSCADVRMFTKLVRTFQKADDNIVHVLNRPDARTMANCSKLFENFARAHERRKAAIERCIAELAPGVEELARQAAAPGADKSLRTKLTAEQAKVRRAGVRATDAAVAALTWTDGQRPPLLRFSPHPAPPLADRAGGRGDRGGADRDGLPRPVQRHGPRLQAGRQGRARRAAIAPVP